MPDIPPQLAEVAYFAQHLNTIEFVWFLAWNIADGQWAKIGIGETAGRGQLLCHFSKLQDGGRFEVLKESSGRLQQRLMALRRGTFEEIQQEAPFSRHAQQNMEDLLRAWKNKGEAGFSRAWEQAFPVGGEAVREPQDLIRIIGEVGDCEERALEVKGAPDRHIRVAAEWWYLYYTFGRNWTPGMHFTTGGNQEGVRFSVHNITVLPGDNKRIYFKLPW